MHIAQNFCPSSRRGNSCMADTGLKPVSAKPLLPQSGRRTKMGWSCDAWLGKL